MDDRAAITTMVVMEMAIFAYYALTMTFGSFGGFLLKMLGLWYLTVCSVLGTVIGLTLGLILLGDNSLDLIKDQIMYVSHFSTALAHLDVYGPNKTILAFFMLAAVFPIMLPLDILWNTFVLCFVTAPWPYAVGWSAFMMVGYITALDWGNKIKMAWGLLR